MTPRQHIRADLLSARMCQGQHFLPVTTMDITTSHFRHDAWCWNGCLWLRVLAHNGRTLCHCVLSLVLGGAGIPPPAGTDDSKLLTMSTLNEEGVMHVKQVACDRLLSSRVENKLQVSPCSC